MKPSLRSAALMLTAGLLLAPAALAHTGHLGAHNGMTQGFVHPFTGLDHMLAMVTVGLWAATRRGRLLWALPLAFMSAMAVGGALGISGVALPMVENGIAASVFVLGLIVAAAAMRVPSAAALVLVAVCGLFHGHAHGAEMAAGAGALSYTLGMLLSTGLLHAAGLGAMALALRKDWSLRVARIGAGAIACCGLLMLAGVL